MFPKVTFSIMTDINKIIIDSRLLQSRNQINRLARIVNNAGFSSIESFFICRSRSEIEAVDRFTSDSIDIKPEIIKLSSTKAEPRAIYDAIGASKSYSTLSERIDVSKKLLYLGLRSSKFIDRFKPPKGVICYPFYKIALGTQCPYDCSYCYLQLTYRITPYPRIYLNLDKLFRELKSFASKSKITRILNAGELSDPLALDDSIELIPEVIKEILKYPNLELLLLTKSSNVGHLPNIDDSQRRIIISASLTSPFNQSRFEYGTATINQRIEALQKAKQKGYRIRVRIDPIISSFPGWEEQYEMGLIKIMSSSIKPEVITLGQPRFYPPLLRIAVKRFPEEIEFWNSMKAQTKDHRIRASNLERLQAYDAIVNMIHDYYGEKTPFIAFCKEDPDIVKALQLPIRRSCNCLPTLPQTICKDEQAA